MALHLCIVSFMKNYEPEKRPNTKEVVSMLKKMASPEVNHEKKGNPSTYDESSLKSDVSSEIKIDNDDLILDELFDQFKNIKSKAIHVC
ncbi:16410_t:CDS:2 [Funneliformis mosseae]|uniref:16410_t:CDS:1 n=1 Tax=Funneliformis mosseae TaxID=27381 RepID=A0A9N9BBR3_FUNMO|nr:16410_t:CDS:2 [Funneliformis mosseae]